MARGEQKDMAGAVAVLAVYCSPGVVQGTGSCDKGRGGACKETVGEEAGEGDAGESGSTGESEEGRVVQVRVRKGGWRR